MIKINRKVGSRRCFYVGERLVKGSVGGKLRGIRGGEKGRVGV